MRLRDSGMPEEAYWETLFDVGLILERMGIDRHIGDVAELGCGYGTFTIPVAGAVSGTVYTFDIDSAMVERTIQRAAGLRVVAECRDVMENGFGISGVDAMLLFNILHCDNPERLLKHGIEAVRSGGLVLVIHWRFDPRTPRGPSLSIRPHPKQIIGWAESGGRLKLLDETIDLPPWHYGLRFALQTQ